MSYTIPHKQITDNPWQTRREYSDEDIEALADDIRRNGLLHSPIGRINVINDRMINYESPLSDLYGDNVDIESIDDLVSYIEENSLPYSVQIACGHTRLRAWRLLHAEHDYPRVMPIDLRSLTDEDMQSIAWSENAQRKDITAYEEALAIKKRIQDFEWTHEETASHLGLARATVSNKLRLLDLPEHVRDALIGGRISERQSMALLPAFMADPEIVEISKSKKWMSSPDELFEAALGGTPAEAIRADWKRTTNWVEHEKQRLAEMQVARDDDGDDEAAAEASEYEDDVAARKNEMAGVVDRWLGGKEANVGQALALLVNRLAPKGHASEKQLSEYLTDTPTVADWMDDNIVGLKAIFDGTATPEEYQTYATELPYILAGFIMYGDLDMYCQYGIRPREITCKTLGIFEDDEVMP